MASSFPVGSSVILQNLVGAAQYNGKKGIVKSRIASNNGRQEVYVIEADKTMAIKPANLTYVPRELSSLSVSEMKAVLMESIGSSIEGELAGLEKDVLQSMVKEVTTSSDELAKLIAKANEPKDVPAATTNNTSSSTSSFNSSQLRQGAERMASMNPDQLRQQAATMKAMGPAALRATNPAMAHLTDAQINMSISQMEAMANNPQMMKMAMDQMKNMSQSDLDEAMKQNPLAPQSSSSSNNNSNDNAAATYPDVRSASAASSGRSTVPEAVQNMSSDQFKAASQQMASMSPDQLKQQASMLKSMSKDTLRRSNPYMANMTDAEIDIAIQQMESMASSPEMLKMASEQLKNMTPEQFQQMKSMAGSGGMVGGSNDNTANATAGTPAANGGAAGANMPTDPSQMMEALFSNPEQLNSMVKMMKQNPDMMKQALAAQFGSDEAKLKQMEKAVDQFAQMDDKQLERYLKCANTVQAVAKPAMNLFTTVKNTLGVSSKTLFALMNIVFTIGVYMLYKWVRSRGEVSLVQDIDMPPEIVSGEDEF